MSISMEILPHQQEMIDSDAFVCAIVGGVGSGKSHALGMEVFRWLQMESPKSAILAVAPTHEQLDKATLSKLKKMLNEAGLEYCHGIMPPDDWDVPLRKEFRRFNNVICVETGHLIVCASMDNPDSIRGPQYGLAILDEAAFYPDLDCLDIVLGRMRCNFASSLRVRIATSPNGRNWFYYTFANPETKRNGYKLIKASSLDNPFNPEEYRAILGSYDDQRYRQEVLAEFIEIGQERVYTEFKVEKHVLSSLKYNKNIDLRVGMDFNRSPLCWVIGQQRNSGEILIFDEIVIPSEATTWSACEELRSRYPKCNIFAYPDAQCRAEHTMASSTGAKSDMDVLMSPEYDLQIVCGRKNPNVINRIDRVQMAFRSDKLFISPDAPRLIDSLLNTAYERGTRHPKKSRRNKEIGEHPTDALGYMVYWCGVDVGIQELSW